MQTPKKPLKTLLDETDTVPDIVVGDQVEWGFNLVVNNSGRVIDIARNVINTLCQAKSGEALVIRTDNGQTVTMPQRRLPDPYTWRGYFLRKVTS